MPKKHAVILSLGSNLGRRRKNLDHAVKELSKQFRIEKKSSVYKSKAVGYKNQPDFFNQCIQIGTGSSPMQLLNDIKRIETAMGRKRTFRWGPRLIDIDIIYFGDKKYYSENLVIPHKEFKNRRFVLEPLLEIRGNFPINNRSLLYFLNRTLEQTCEKI